MPNLKPVLFYCPQMATIAQKIKDIMSDDIEVGEIDWQKFENEWPNLFVSNARNLNGRKVIFLASFDTPSEAMRQFFVLRAIPFFTGENVFVSLPYFPTATKERMVRYGEIITAKGLTELLSQAMPKYVKYEFAIYDMHTKPGVTAFGDFVRPLYLSALGLLWNRVKAMNNIAICYPDKGAWTRFEEERGLFSSLPFIRCVKDRLAGDTVVRIVEGDPRDKNVVIIDDLVTTGKTLARAAAEMMTAGAHSVSAYATHGVFPQNSWNNFVGQSVFKNFWITDSCPTTAEAVNGLAPFEVISLAPSIAELFKQSINT